MDNEKDIISLGEWKVPTKWEDIDLKTYQELERFYDGKDELFNKIMEQVDKYFNS